MLVRVIVSLVLATAAKAQSAIVFANVTVVDVEAGVLRPNQTVIVEGVRIAAADDAAKVPIPRTARVIDGKGKFLIPGLWDMHVHEFPEPHIPELFLANGITGIRDMYDDAPKIRELKKAIQEHRQTGPRVVASGPVLNGVFEKNAQVVVRTPEQARQAVRQQVKDGVDFIKIYNGLSREAFYAIAEESKRSNVTFVGHTPDSVTTVEAAAAGQRSIEHLDGVLLDSASNSAALRQAHRFIPDRGVLQSFDPDRAKQLFATYVRYGTWHCPTLSVYRADVLMNDPAAAKDPNFRLFPAIWLPKPSPKKSRDEALDRAVEQKMMEVTAMMFRAGVRLLAGTDTGYPFVLPGFGLHDELELMVSAGVPDSAVLRIATLAPAQFLGRNGELGSVKRGKLADLVLLGADPLKSIANTRLVRAVVADGCLYDRAALDSLLADAKSAASR
jgi:Amidohydrolase family